MYNTALRTGLILILFALTGVPSRQALSSVQGENAQPLYKIQKGDTLNITVLDEDDLTKKYAVDDKGKILFPMLGKIKVSGQTSDQIEEHIVALLKDGYILNPIVSVQAVFDKTAYIMGDVHNPGQYPLPKKTAHILQIVAMAGGYKTPDASYSYEIIRETDNEKTHIESISAYTGILNGDIVIVKETKIP